MSIGTIGHVDHGEIASAAAIAMALAATGRCTTRKYDEIDAAPGEEARDITINTTHVEYEISL